MADFAALAANAKKAPNVKNAVLLLKHMRAHKVRRSDLVVTYGGIALRNAKRLGDDAWAVYEQTLLALDVDDRRSRRRRGDALLARFEPKDGGKPSARVERLKGLVAEARGDWDGALANEICVLKGKGAAPAAVAEALNGYVVKFQSDQSAWQALGELYAANLRFADAIFCYEELTLFDPLAQHYHRRLGELYYSLAAANAKDAEPRYRNARKYFAKSLELRKAANARAATGLLLACSALKVLVRGDKVDADDELNAALGSVAAAHLKAAYAMAPAELQAANAAVLDAHAPPYARLLPAKDADPQ
ncbi:hypothetical protein JL722_14893 [Aureococcus anophagefferens]|nr:hypothetical protein JL722_14893 [Aureococcus anophagefferens]